MGINNLVSDEYLEDRGIKPHDMNLSGDYKIYAKGTERYLLEVHRDVKGKSKGYEIIFSYDLLDRDRNKCDCHYD